MIVNGDALRELRLDHGLTLKEVAARLNVAEATVSRYESGQIKRISPNVLLGYSKLFNVPINQLYENAETEWVRALTEAGLCDPRVRGFIEYLEEKAQAESEDLQLTDDEIEVVKAYRSADREKKRLTAYALGLESLVKSIDSKGDK